jgi:PST family polysaccharide transporter
MSLRETAARGGAYLAVRDILGILLKFGGVVLVTRLIGPTGFGLYAGSLAVVTLLTTIAQLGSEVYLIRSEREPTDTVYNQVFTVLLFSTTATVVLGFAASLVVTAAIGAHSFMAPFRVMLLSIPLSALWAPAQAKLERAFRYRRMAMLQFGQDFVLYLVAVPLAYLGAGYWAPIAGTFAAYAWLLVFSYVLASLRPRVRFSRERVAELVRYGMAFTPAGVFAQAQSVVNPLVVGPLLGPASVGCVALALRLVDNASFVLRATYRVSLVAFARVQGDPTRLRRGFEEMMSLQVLAMAPVLVVLSATGPWLIPLIFKPEFRPTADVLPFVAASALLLCIFNTHGALLYVLGRTAVASVVGLIRLVLLILAALALVPPFGLVGYGFAVLIAAAGWLVLDRQVSQLLDFRYGLALRWVIVFTPPIFACFARSAWGLLLFLPAVIFVVRDAAARAQVRASAGFLAGSLGIRRTAASGE